jgi:hypothetical protein
MPEKETKLSVAVWVGGALIATAVIALIFAIYFYSHTAK